MEFKESISKVLFLDIDGVLSRAEYGKDLYEDTYSDYCAVLHRPSVEALRALLQDEPDLKIVWISDWAKCNGNACTMSHCYVSPLHVLEMFPWLREHVIGDVFSHNDVQASYESKLLAVKKFVQDNLVEHYAIVDDYDAQLPKNSALFQHYVHINSLKSFLQDDIARVKAALKTMMDGQQIKDTLLSMSINDSFIVNGKWECTFNGIEQNGMFANAEKNANCPRLESSANVLVHSIVDGEDLVGSIVLAYDIDLKVKPSAMLCIKHDGSSNWETMSTMLQLSNIKRAIA